LPEHGVSSSRHLQHTNSLLSQAPSGSIANARRAEMQTTRGKGAKGFPAKFSPRCSRQAPATQKRGEVAAAVAVFRPPDRTGIAYTRPSSEAAAPRKHGRKLLEASAARSRRLPSWEVAAIRETAGFHRPSASACHTCHSDWPQTAAAASSALQPKKKFDDDCKNISGQRQQGKCCAHAKCGAKTFTTRTFAAMQRYRKVRLRGATGALACARS